MKHLTAPICLTIAVLFGNFLLNATSAQRVDADVIESEKEKIKVRQREAAKRLALLKIETTENINDFKTKALELCKEKYLGSRQNAKRKFEKYPAWLQALDQKLARKQK